MIITGDFNSTPGDKVCLAFISLPFEADLLKRASCFLLSSVIQSVVEPSYYRGDSESFFSILLSVLEGQAWRSG